MSRAFEIRRAFIPSIYQIPVIDRFYLPEIQSNRREISAG
jgi:hypothetical protein